MTVGRVAIPIVAALLVIGCASTAHAPTSTVTIITPAASPTTAVLSADPGVTVENIVLACRDKNAAALSTLIYAEVSHKQIDALFALGRDVVLKSQTSTVTGDQASITIDLEIHRSAGTERAQRTWNLVRGADGFWRLTALPDCY